MASVHERPDRKLSWESKWRDPETGRQRSKGFAMKRDAMRHGIKMESAKLDGSYVDAAKGQVTFMEYAEAWRKVQVHRESTAQQIVTNMTRHVYPRIGKRPLASLRRSDLQKLVKSLSADLAPNTVGVVFSWVGSILKAAASDRVIPSSPAVGVKLPIARKPKVVPLDPDVVAKLAVGIDERFRAAVILGAGTGMRIAEVLALTVDRVDFLKGRITVDRQLQRTAGQVPVFGPLKDRHNRPRTIPVGLVVTDALAEHLARFGSGPEGLIFTSPISGPVKHSTWSYVWQQAAGALGIAKGEGFHQLRHFYASTLIRGGCTVKEVQERLGHASASMTLDIYSHLWPEDDERTQVVTDGVLRELFA